MKDVLYFSGEFDKMICWQNNDVATADEKSQTTTLIQIIL